MEWLAGIVVLVILVVHPGFRKFVGVLIAIVAVIGGLYYLQNEREDRLSLSRIEANELAFEDMTLKREHGSYYIFGRIKNNSTTYSLKGIVLTVTVLDCSGETSPENCIAIGEGDATEHLTIPPGQARDFETYVYFSGEGPKPKGRLEWYEKISQIKAE